MCTMLLLLYFFFNQLGKALCCTVWNEDISFLLILFSVYVIIGMFVFATVIATYACIEPLVMASYSVFPRPILQLPRINLGCAVIHLEFRFFLKEKSMQRGLDQTFFFVIPDNFCSSSQQCPFRWCGRYSERKIGHGPFRDVLYVFNRSWLFMERRSL